MPLLIGFLLVLLAALLQGTFVLPMTLVRQWSWEHTWATFSLLGMFVFNWIITLLLVPNIFAVYSASPAQDLAVLALFGLGWGVGAVLFGLGMERLGMALGYPIIMGLIASLGALIPLLRVLPANASDDQRLGSARRNRAGDLRHRAVLHCRFAQNAFRSQVHRNAVERIQDRPGHRDPGRHTLVPAQCGHGIRRKRDRRRRVPGSFPGFFRQYGVGASVYSGMCRQPRILPVPDDQQTHAGPILEPGDAAQPGH